MGGGEREKERDNGVAEMHEIKKHLEVTTWRGGIGRVGGRCKREEIWRYMYTYS